MGDCAFGGWPVTASALLGGIRILPVLPVQRNKKEIPRSKKPGGAGGADDCPVHGLLAQALLHEGFAFIALEGFGFSVHVAGFHLALLGGGLCGSCGWAGAQAIFHEGLALVAFQGFGLGVGVAGAHFALLCRFGGCRCGGRRRSACVGSSKHLS